MTSQLLLNFLSSQKTLTMATVDSLGEPWVSTVYYATDEEVTIYFLTDPKSSHAAQFANSQSVAFSVSWFNSQNTSDRKGIQAKGKVELITNKEELEVFRKCFFVDKFGGDGINYISSMQDGSTKYKAWKIVPSYIKFWNDEAFGEGGIEEYNL